MGSLSIIFSMIGGIDMKHLSILQDIYHLVQHLLKYQRLRYVHRISMQVYQEEMTRFVQNRQKKSYRNQEILRSFGMDPKTLKKVIFHLQRKYPNCFEYVKLDSKNKGLFLSNQELFKRMVFTW